MKKIIVIALLVSVMWGVSAQAGTGRIAAFPFTGNVVENTADGEFYVGLFTSQFVTLGYTLVSRTAAIDIAMQEISYQSSGMTNEIVEIGKQLSADYVLVGSLGKIADRYTIRAEVVSVETSEIAASDTQIIVSLNQIFDSNIMSQMVSNLHDQITNRMKSTLAGDAGAINESQLQKNIASFQYDYAQYEKSKKIARGFWIGGLVVAGASVGIDFIMLGFEGWLAYSGCMVGGAAFIGGGIADIVYTGKMNKIEETLYKNYGIEVAFNPIIQPVYAPLAQNVNWNIGGSLKVSL
ncbi:MAG: FlgO family outer membrane protein [Spirochaetales bacterium]